MWATSSLCKLQMRETIRVRAKSQKVIGLDMIEFMVQLLRIWAKKGEEKHTSIIAYEVPEEVRKNLEGKLFMGEELYFE